MIVDEFDSIEPSDLIGLILADEAELAAFEDLSAFLMRLIGVIGRLGTYGDAIASGQPWTECVLAARRLQALMGRPEPSPEPGTAP